ncbi:MAG: glutamate 5-kinase [Deferribacteres bacterium]|nr:glutamate 5-kinase [Deferribacteres bacterium]
MFPRRGVAKLVRQRILVPPFVGSSPAAPAIFNIIMRNLPEINTLVIKIGSSILTGSTGEVNLEFIQNLSDTIIKIKQRVKNIVIVSSGAVACGFKVLGFERKPKDIIDKQACAAVGQTRLIQCYESCFMKHGINVGQVLITKDDFSNRRRYLNAKYTIRRLFDFGVIPIINENDSVVIDELKYYETFGDNDNLSALVSGLLSADLLLILSDVEGLYDKNPAVDKNAKLISEVKYFNEELLNLGGDSVSGLGTGGMRSKLLAAKKALDAGCLVGIVSGKDTKNIERFLNNEEVGTFFGMVSDRKSKKQHWLAYATIAKGEIIIDDGAVNALYNNKSLLPSGIVDITGRFNIGDIVRVVNLERVEIARGKVRYSFEDLKKIMGKKSSQIAEILGYKLADEVIHIDDMVITYK